MQSGRTYGSTWGNRCALRGSSRSVADEPAYSPGNDAAHCCQQRGKVVRGWTRYSAKYSETRYGNALTCYRNWQDRQTPTSCSRWHNQNCHGSPRGGERYLPHTSQTTRAAAHNAQAVGGNKNHHVRYGAQPMSIWWLAGWRQGQVTPAQATPGQLTLARQHDVTLLPWQPAEINPANKYPFWRPAMSGSHRPTSAPVSPDGRRRRTMQIPKQPNNPPVRVTNTSDSGRLLVFQSESSTCQKVPTGSPMSSLESLKESPW